VSLGVKRTLSIGTSICRRLRTVGQVCVSQLHGPTNAQALKETHDRLSLPADSLLFLSHQNKPMTDPKEWFGRACEEAKIAGVTWHTLRHTFASRLVMAGVGLKEVQELMGHKTITMTARYAHLAPAIN